MTQSAEDRLHQALWSFHAAVQLRDGVEGRIRRGEMDGDILDRSLQAAEAVVQARVTLYRLLIADGWTPPPSVAQDLAHDDLLLHQPAEHLL